MLLPNPDTDAVLYAALEKSASQLGKGGREKLAPGAKHEVNLTVTGWIDDTEVDKAITGHLTIGHDGTYQANESVPIARLLAAVLTRVPKTKREALLQELVDEFQRSGDVPAAIELVAVIDEWLPKLSRKVTKPKRGAVSFALPVAA
jgi:hypothetical protein